MARSGARAPLARAPSAHSSDGGSAEDEEEDFSEDADKPLGFERVLAEELSKIEELHRDRAPDGRPSQKFSLAFSGGGIRAAAFQAGVLWRLAAEDKLKDVEYFTAVSGGGYITSAFATHVLGMDQPEKGEPVRDWYLKVVARTICRMQRNSGDFVRDAFKAPFAQEEGASVLPRVFDLPILLVTLFITLSVNPIFFVIAVLVPFTICTNMLFGGAMRAAFCYETPFTEEWLGVFANHSHIMRLVHLLVILLGINLVVHFATGLLPTCKLQPSEEPPENGRPKRPEASLMYLLGHSTRSVLRRFTFLLVFYITFILFVPGLQVVTYGVKFYKREPYCARYIREQHANRETCANHHLGVLWYDDPLFGNYTSRAQHLAGIVPSAPPPPMVPPVSAVSAASDAVARSSQANAELEEIREHSRSFFGGFVLVILVVMVGAVVAMPILGPALLIQFCFAMGPLGLVAAMLAFVQIAVYGPVTRNERGAIQFDPQTWETFVSVALTMALVLLPFYEEIRSLLHIYYKRSLRGNFFCRGEERRVVEMADNPYCPFVILTGTCSDYKPPGENDTISELSFSALHLGGEETGYVRQPEYEKMSKITAITGAGCLDAISLSMNDAIAMRFWLEVLNLSWGDYIIFDHLHKLRFSNFGDMQGFFVRMLHRAPAGTLWLVIFAMLNAGWYNMSLDNFSCELSHNLIIAAASSFLVVLMLSFYTFVPFVDLLTLSPLIRQFHQASKFLYVGKRPPRMLYMTDGGVRDCTSLVQLLWRRRERILLVLAAADPHDDLGVLKAAMAVAKELKLATFYDPEDPRRDLSVLFARFKEDKEQTHMHIGISYCWEDGTGGTRTGHLFIVKNRLPPSFSGTPVAPPLTEAEIVGKDADAEIDESDMNNNEAREFFEEDWEGLTTDQLGPFGCCDCCHTRGLNCGPKFPHGTFTGYLYLTPQWFSSLCRLGHQLCGGAIDEVTRPGRLGGKWEQTL